MAEDDKAAPRFLAVGHDGLRMTSDNGTDWSEPELGKEGEVYRFARYGNGRFVTAGRYGGINIYASSPDGIEWQTGTRDARYARYITGLAFGNGQFLAFGGDAVSVGRAQPFALTSKDGVEWGESADTEGAYVLRRAAWGNDRWVGVGDRGRRAVSTDGLKWEEAPGSEPKKRKVGETCIDIAFGNGVFVGVGLHGLRMKTEDGLAWSEPQRGEEGEHLNSVLWTGEQFVAMGAGATYFSKDGTDWARHPNTDAPLTAAFGNGIYVGAKWKGRLMHSTDAVEWKQTRRAEQHVEGLCFGGGTP